MYYINSNYVHKLLLYIHSHSHRKKSRKSVESFLFLFSTVFRGYCQFQKEISVIFLLPKSWTYDQEHIACVFDASFVPV